MIENWMSSVRFAKKVETHHRFWSSSSNQMRLYSIIKFTSDDLAEK